MSKKTLHAGVIQTVAHVNRGQQEANTIYRSGSPASGYSYTQDGKPVSEE